MLARGVHLALIRDGVVGEIGEAVVRVMLVVEEYALGLSEVDALDIARSDTASFGRWLSASGCRRRLSLRRRLTLPWAAPVCRIESSEW